MPRKPGFVPPHPGNSCASHTPSHMQSTIVHLARSICVLLLIAIPAFAQSSALSIPENASAKSYGEGWECDLGYRIDGADCAAIIVPENAYETNRAYGTGWECLYGFRRTDETACVAVTVPDGGFLDPSGERWQCLRGYLRINDACQEIVLPANAYLTDKLRGPAWACERGFEAKDDGCAAIVVPANAYLNALSYGRPWTCERTFIEHDGLCEAVVIPQNAYFDDTAYSKGWKCERGYAVSGNTCEAIDLPTNAHLDWSGNRWECDRNFQKSKGMCVLNN